MPELKNPRYEAVAKAMALGDGPTGACRAAGYAANRVKVASHRIAARPEIVNRSNELRAILRPTPTALAEMGRGLEYLRPDRLRATLITELREIMVDAREAKDRRSAIAAAQEIATLAGIRITKQESEVRVKGPLGDLSDEARQALIRQLEDARKPVVDSVAELVGESAEHLPARSWAALSKPEDGRADGACSSPGASDPLA